MGRWRIWIEVGLTAVAIGTETHASPPAITAAEHTSPVSLGAAAVSIASEDAESLGDDAPDAPRPSASMRVAQARSPAGDVVRVYRAAVPATAARALLDHDMTDAGWAISRAADAAGGRIFYRGQREMFASFDAEPAGGSIVVLVELAPRTGGRGAR